MAHKKPLIWSPGEKDGHSFPPEVGEFAWHIAGQILILSIFTKLIKFAIC